MVGRRRNFTEALQDTPESFGPVPPRDGFEGEDFLYWYDWDHLSDGAGDRAKEPLEDFVVGLMERAKGAID